MADHGDDSDLDDEDEDAEFGVPGLEEDPYYITILDEVDPYLVFQQNAAVIKDCVGTLTVEEQQVLQKVMAYVKKE